MAANKKSTLRTVLIAIAAGILLGGVVGFVAGTYNLPVAIIIPAVIVPVAFVSFLYLMKRQGK